jgi:Flp pilus assembly pilin Flp
LFRAPTRRSIALKQPREEAMLYMLLGYLHAATFRRVKEIHRLAEEKGQGTVEYVGLILLVALLMVGMVAGMKGFQGKQGTELADVIVNKIKEAVDKVAFK